METLYDILEVSRKASPEVIDKAYKILAKRYHPDIKSGEEKLVAEEKMKQINEAYMILSDEQKRKEYDKKLEAQEKIEPEVPEEQNDISEEDLQFLNWQKAYAALNKREQAKLKKKIEREANEEYRKRYEDYFRSLGYEVKHKWTKKEFLILFSIIILIALTFTILWNIPKTHNWMIDLYNNNESIKIIVNIIIGVFRGIEKFFKIVFKV